MMSALASLFVNGVVLCMYGSYGLAAMLERVTSSWAHVTCTRRSYAPTEAIVQNCIEWLPEVKEHSIYLGFLGLVDKQSELDFTVSLFSESILVPKEEIFCLQKRHCMRS